MRLLPGVPIFSGMWCSQSARLAEDEKVLVRFQPFPFFMAGSGESAAGFIRRLFPVQLGILHPFFSECSLEAKALGLGPRPRVCKSCRSDHFFVANQVCGSVSGAPAREAGEAGANPAHLTMLRRGHRVRSMPSVALAKEGTRSPADEASHGTAKFARGDEAVESALCRREVSRCESDHERHFSSGGW